MTLPASLIADLLNCLHCVTSSQPIPLPYGTAGLAVTHYWAFTALPSGLMADLSIDYPMTSGQPIALADLLNGPMAPQG